jgi:hypothetical protein
MRSIFFCIFFPFVLLSLLLSLGLVPKATLGTGFYFEVWFALGIAPRARVKEIRKDSAEGHKETQGGNL